MNIIHNKLKDLGKYLLSVCDNTNQEFIYNIKGSFIELPEFLIPQVLNSLRPEDETENVDEDTTLGIPKRRSQLNEWAFVYAVDLSNQEVKNTLNIYLNELLGFKNLYKL